MYDIGIHCGYLLSMQAAGTTILPQQFLAIHAGKIVQIKPWDSQDKSRVAKFIDASQQLVMPGLINGHAHLPMNLLRGLAEDQPFWQWLQQIILPIEKLFVNPEFVRIGTELALLELIRAGVTTVCDMYYFEDIIAECVDKIGTRAVLGETIADFPCPDDPHNNGNCYHIVEKMVARFIKHPRITTCIAPHSPYGCSDATLKKVMQYADKHQLLIKIHAAESQEEVSKSLADYGLSPVQRLYQLGLMNYPAIFAHGVWVNEHDIELIAKTDTRIIYNPNSNMKLSCGIAPLRQFLQQGITVGIGTDSAASNNGLNIISELATGIKLQKLHNADISITVKDMLAMATINGAKALGLEEQIGSLAVGKYADCIIVDINLPHWQPLYDIPSALVYSANGAEVATTICHGKILMENRIIKTIDVDTLYAEAKHLSAQIHNYITEKNMA
jgi:5-methylthioadenosine/S-adenosylhomocysteine deaminase